MTGSTLVLVTDGYVDRSLTYPVHRLREAGQDVVLGTPDGGVVESTNTTTFESAESVAIDAVDPAAYDRVLVPSFDESERIRDLQPDGTSLVRSFFAAGDPVAAIGRGSLVLAMADILSGHRLACHEAVADAVIDAGGEVADELATVDDNLITARDAGQVTEWMIDVLETVETESASYPAVFEPIGTIHSPHDEEVGTPIQPVYSGSEGVVEVDERYAPGLDTIETFSHLFLLYEFHSAGGYQLRPQPFKVDRQIGIFSTRAPRRPNPIGLSVVKLEEVSGNRLRVSGIDVLDGTPLLDIKPFVPEYNDAEDVRIGFLEGRMGEDSRQRADDRFIGI